ncbi:hypothetical protein [Streptomyces sp. SID3343]|uniref:hypothetical protein n=1 Tax=Streptomyces sp. SID3343 TaxID=2690260 RepID=UPI00136C24C2|nr:hypothetical protein [Streptomyces sp. SID3343]MYW04558.1 hypothetical protein [Streptomyces sp. SID3343]
MNYVRNFAPWIVFAAVPSTNWQWGALAALAVTLYLAFQDHRAERGVDLLAYSTAAFFLVVTPLAFATPDSDFRRYVGAASLAWLAVTAWASIAAHKPFTLVIARRSTPREIWELPAFMSINVVITAVWAASFTATAVALYVVRSHDLSSNVAIAVQAAGFVVPAMFTARYPAIVQARHSA